MKKTILSIATICALIASNPVICEATVVAPPTTTAGSSNPATSSAINSLLLRLEEIKSMDKSKLESSQKKELRKEVKTIRKQLHDHDYTGVYISGTALLIIIILLIILL